MYMNNAIIIFLFSLSDSVVAMNSQQVATSQIKTQYPEVCTSR